MPVWVIPDIVGAAKEAVLVAWGSKALSDAKLARIKSETAAAIRRAGGDETAVQEAMAEIDRHAAQLGEQIPVKGSDLAKDVAGNLFTILRWAAVGIGIVAGIAILGRSR